MNDFYVAVGDATTFTKTVGEYDVYSFAGISGDFAPNHVNKAYMEKSSYGRLIAHGALLVVAITPEQLARCGRGVARQRRQQVHAVRRILRIRSCTGGRKKRRHPIHADRHLLRFASWPNVPRPAHQRWNANTSFQQFRLLTSERPGV